MSPAASTWSAAHPLRRAALWAGAGTLLLALAILAGTAIGETAIPPGVVAQTLANRMFGAAYPLDPVDEGVVWSYRFCRAIVAAACGAGLALSGLVLQTLLRNALADPYLLGISAGASTGAVAVTVAGLGGGAVSLSLGAFIGALVAFSLVIALARASGGFGGSSTGQIVLAGIAGSQLFNALTSFIIAQSANAEQARGIMFWLLGNLSGVRWPDVWLAAPVALLILLVCVLHTRMLDAFTFGSDAAASMGVPVLRTRVVLIGAAALATSVMVSILGSIGFVGLVIPHAARLLAGARHGRLVPASALIGAVFMIVADIVSRVIIPGQVLPIGVITALIGAPAFAIILIRGQGGAR